MASTYRHSDGSDISSLAAAFRDSSNSTPTRTQIRRRRNRTSPSLLSVENSLNSNYKQRQTTRQRNWYPKVTSINFKDMFSDRLYLFDADQLRTLRFDPGELQKRDILIAGWLREQTDGALYFPMVVIHLILVRLPKFELNDEIKMVLGGLSAVGKTSLTKHIVSKDWKLRMKMRPTLSMDYHTNRYHNELMNRELRLNVYDCSGNPKRRRMMKNVYFNGADITVIVYDITNRKSLEFALDLIDHDVDEGTKVCLVGNKADLKYDRKISRDEAMEVAEERGAHFVEVSAGEHDKVLEMFQEFTNKMMYKFPPDPYRPSFMPSPSPPVSRNPEEVRTQWKEKVLGGGVAYQGIFGM